MGVQHRILKPLTYARMNRAEVHWLALSIMASDTAVAQRVCMHAKFTYPPRTRAGRAPTINRQIEASTSINCDAANSGEYSGDGKLDAIKRSVLQHRNRLTSFIEPAFLSAF